MLKNEYNNCENPYAFKEILGNEFFSKEEHNGSFLAFRKGYEFLQNPEKWNCLKNDLLVIPQTKLFALDGNLFIESEFASGLGRPKFLESLSRKKFQNVRFEEVIGFRQKPYSESLIYHEYSEKITLDKIKATSPKGIRNSIEVLVAKAFRELHENEILYGEWVPTNVAYDGESKIILSPHNAIRRYKQSGADEKIRWEKEKDLAVIALTHDYIADVKQFIKTYNLQVSKNNQIKTKEFMEGLSCGYNLQGGGFYITEYWEKAARQKIQNNSKVGK
jgi:hypothetical protein